MSGWSGWLAGSIQGVLRLGVALVVAAVVIPPASAGVAVATLLYAPVPGGELPEERPLLSAVPSVALDVNGDEIAVFRGFDRTVEVSPGEVPDLVKNAVIAIEDQRFWTHRGVDFEGISRAARTNLELGEVVQGGSTITQQYIKNVYLSREQTFERKVEEALLAVELEKRLTKEEILHGYLTSSYFGEGAYGIGAAAEVYFGTDVGSLDISEAATLAGVLQAPTRLSPRNDLDAAEQRRRLVLEAMFEQGYLSEADLEREVARHLWLPEQGERPSTAVTVLAARPAKGASDHPLLRRLGRGRPAGAPGARPALSGRAHHRDHDRPRPPGRGRGGGGRPAGRHRVSGGDVAGVARPRHRACGGDGRGARPRRQSGEPGHRRLHWFPAGSSFKPIVLAAAFELGLGPDTVYSAPASWTVPGCSGSQCTPLQLRPRQPGVDHPPGGHAGLGQHRVRQTGA